MGAAAKKPLKYPPKPKQLNAAAAAKPSNTERIAKSKNSIWMESSELIRSLKLNWLNDWFEQDLHKQIWNVAKLIVQLITYLTETAQHLKKNLIETAQHFNKIHLRLLLECSVSLVN